MANVARDRDFKAKLASGDLELSARAQLLDQYVVFGCPHQRLVEPHGLDADKPLTLEEAARVLKLRLRFARQIASSPKYLAYHAKLLGDSRSGAKAKAMHRIIELASRKAGDEDETAADARVSLEASQAILDEGQRGININVGIQNNLDGRMPTKIGYVIRAPQQPREPLTIDATARALPPADDVAQTLDTRRFEPAPAETGAFDSFVRKWRP
jgi:hypothetical protein